LIPPTARSLNLISSSSAANHGRIDSEVLFNAMPFRELQTFIFCMTRCLAR
jgi:hypothetical protein